jgi:hypothetical protein
MNVAATAGFLVGEIITQEASNARGMIKDIANGVFIVQNLRYNTDNDFIPTVGATTKIMGEDSGALTDLVSSEFLNTGPRLGHNIDIGSELIVASGAITSVKILDSGFGFTNGEPVVIQSGNNIATGYAVNKTHGTGSGYYRTNDGFLSDEKKLSDGYYYQEYSYEVRSAVISDFRSVLKDVVHVAGTKYFDALVYDTINSLAPSAHSTIDSYSAAILDIYWESDTLWGTDDLNWGDYRI